MWNHNEKHEERLNASFQAMDSATRIMKLALIGICLLVTALLWFLHLGVLSSMRGGSMLGALFSMRGLMILFFIPPFIAAYCLGKHIIAATKPEDESGVMSSYAQIHASNREWKVVMIAAVVGVVNSFLMMFTTTLK